jgi:16S rRNA (guanine1207-N2)-methyltransferase
MERSSELIVRNLAQLEPGAVLLFNPAADTLFQQLEALGHEVRIWNQDFGASRWFLGNDANAGFGVFPDPAGLPAQIVLFQPKEKDRLEMLLHFLSHALPASGRLWLVGENQAGIKSAGKRLETFFRTTRKLDSARHCVVYEARSPAPPESFRLETYLHKWSLDIPPSELRLVSLPGVFAHGRLDRGTEVLLQAISRFTAKSIPAGRVLDFGCGIGVIGLSLLVRNPEVQLTLLDHSALALESARLSLLANGLHAELMPSDGLTEVRQRFDWIVSNPPFHRGVASDYGVAQRFFAQARTVLSKQGKILLVCNIHLPYESWLAEQFGRVEQVGNTSGYKVLRASALKF